MLKLESFMTSQSVKLQRHKGALLCHREALLWSTLRFYFHSLQLGILKKSYNYTRSLERQYLRCLQYLIKTLPFLEERMKL